MSERKINLEEIIRESIIEYLTPKLQNPGQALGIANRIIEKDWYVKAAMLEFGKKLLELASENAKAKLQYIMFEDCNQAVVDKQSIINTINQAL